MHFYVNNFFLLHSYLCFLDNLLQEIVLFGQPNDRLPVAVMSEMGCGDAH